MKAITPGHQYELDNVGEGTQTLQFVEKEADPADDTKLVVKTDGTTNEEVLAVLIDRLTFLGETLADDFTSEAIGHLEKALAQLVARTTDRTARGVEGTPVA